MSSLMSDAKLDVPSFGSAAGGLVPAFGQVSQRPQNQPAANHSPVVAESKNPDLSGYEKLLAMDLPFMSHAGEQFYKKQIGDATELDAQHIAAIEEQEEIIEGAANRKEQELLETKNKAVKEYEDLCVQLKNKKRTAAVAKLDYAQRQPLIEEATKLEEYSLEIMKQDHVNAYKYTIGLAEHPRRHWVVPVLTGMLPFSNSYREAMCSICQSKIQDEFASCIPACGHGFCQTCIMPVLDTDEPKCPDCRSPITADWQHKWQQRKHYRKISNLEEQLAKLQQENEQLKLESRAHTGNSPQLQHLSINDSAS